MNADRGLVRDAMRAAARRLPLRADEGSPHSDLLVEEFANAIASMVGGAVNKRKPRRTGKMRVAAELETLAKSAEKLRVSIEEASPAVLQALWDSPSLRTSDGELYRVNIRKMLERLEVDLNHLRLIAKHAPESSDDLGPISGKPADLWAIGIIKLCAWHYKRMTGRVIDQRREEGSFHFLLSQVFASLGIQRSVERAVSDAKRNAWT